MESSMKHIFISAQEKYKQKSKFYTKKKYKMEPIYDCKSYLYNWKIQAVD